MILQAWWFCCDQSDWWLRRSQRPCQPFIDQPCLDVWHSTKRGCWPGRGALWGLPQSLRLKSTFFLLLDKLLASRDSWGLWVNVVDWFPRFLSAPSPNSHDGKEIKKGLYPQNVKWVWTQVDLRKHHYELSYWRWWNSSWAISNPERCCCESAALNMPANLENAAVATGLEKVSFHSNPKERQCQRMLKVPHNCTHLTK